MARTRPLVRSTFLHQTHLGGSPELQLELGNPGVIAPGKNEGVLFSVSGGFLERRIPGQNGNGRYP